MQQVAEPYIRGRALRHLEKDRIVIFAQGSVLYSQQIRPQPFVQLRQPDAILMAKNGADGVYNADP